MPTTTRRARFMIRACALALLAAGAAHAEPVQVPGSTVTMEPPAGFTLSESFSGFEDPATRSSILIAEMPPEAYAEIAAVFASRELASDSLSPQGVTVSDVIRATVNGREVDLVIGEQSAGGITVDKYFAVLDAARTVLVTISAVGEDAPDRRQVVAAIESVTLSAPPTLAEQAELLPFAFESAEPFETRQVMGGSSVLLAPFEGTDPSGELPIVVIAASLADLDASDLQAASERLLEATTGLEGATVAEGDVVTSGEALAWRVEAEAGDRLAIHYLWPLPGDEYLRLVAMGARDELAPLRDVVHGIAESVEPR